MMQTLREYWRAAWLSAEMSYRELSRDEFVIFTVLIQPMIVAFMGLYMLRNQGGDYAIFVVVGGGMTGLWSSLLFLCGNAITLERWTGTLELLIGVPTPLSVITFGRNIAFVVQSFASMIASYFLASVLLGYPLEIDHPLLFAVSALMTVLAFVSFGLMIAPVFLLNPIVQRFQNGLEFPVYILSGFLFPVALLPGWSNPFSYILAPYWAARALHESAHGSGEFGSVASNWAMMLLLAVIYLVLSRYMFRASLHRARVDATLDLQ